jgi:hypothetical protein
VPFFVRTEGGKPVFAGPPLAVKPACLRDGLCWICGHGLQNRSYAFVIPPAGVVSRVTSDPPSHRDCARYALRACPFLKRSVAVLWRCSAYGVRSQGGGEPLLTLGPARAVEWWCDGRPATPPEIAAAASVTAKKTKLPRDEFLARFKARMLRAGERFDDGSSIARYADDTGPTYFDGQHAEDPTITPEECAEADISYWGD